MKSIKQLKFKHLLFAALCCELAASCSTPGKVVYLQDIQPNVTVALQQAKDITLQPGDKLDIRVYSRDKELVQMFNLTGFSGNNSPANGRSSAYTVKENGMIDMPIVGFINVEGLTRTQVADAIKLRLLQGELVRDPVVIVEYSDMNFFVMGDVAHPGRMQIDRDRVTLLEAIAQAGDLSLTGRRDNILVLRTEGGMQTPYRVDITEVNSLYSSPVYYVKQNDLIYVEPNKMRVNSTDVNANTLRTPGFWFGAISFALSLVLLLVK